MKGSMLAEMEKKKEEFAFGSSKRRVEVLRFFVDELEGRLARNNSDISDVLQSRVAEQMALFLGQLGAVRDAERGVVRSALGLLLCLQRFPDAAPQLADSLVLAGAIQSLWGLAHLCADDLEMCADVLLVLAGLASQARALRDVLRDKLGFPQALLRLVHIADTQPLHLPRSTSVKMLFLEF